MKLGETETIYIVWHKTLGGYADGPVGVERTLSEAIEKAEKRMKKYPGMCYIIKQVTECVGLIIKENS